MSRRADLGWVAAVGLALAVVVAGWLWDGALERREPSHTVAADECPVEVDLDEGVRSTGFQLGGTVVKAERWCGVREVRVEAVADVADEGFLVLTAATTKDLVTLRLPHASSAHLRLGADGWVAVSIVQADPETLDGGGAWITLTAGETLR